MATGELKPRKSLRATLAAYRCGCGHSLPAHSFGGCVVVTGIGKNSRFCECSEPQDSMRAAVIASYEAEVTA